MSYLEFKRNLARKRSLNAKVDDNSNINEADLAAVNTLTPITSKKNDEKGDVDKDLSGILSTLVNAIKN